MSRNGSGTYTIPNTFSPGATITSTGQNQNFSDIAIELTNSVAVDGQSTMTGQLKSANGTVSSPAVTFGSDPDSGIYRIGANNIGVAANGAKVLDIATTGLEVTGTLSSTVALTVNGVNMPFPVGTKMLFQQTTAPTGWTKDTTHNDKTLRVVSGTASSGGSVDFSTLHARTATDPVTLAQNNLPNVVPTVSGTQALSHTSSGAIPIVPNAGSGPSIAGGSGITVYATGAYLAIDNHTVNFANATVSSINGGVTQQTFSPQIDMRVKYVDLIIASKD